MTSIIRVDPLNTNTVVANDILAFVIPRGVYDFSNFKLWFTATINGGTANYQSLPRDVETLIEQLEVYLGDQKIQHTINYNQIFRIVEDYNKDMSDHSR